MKRNSSQQSNFKLYTLNFGGVLNMKIMKNLTKVMQNVGEMLNVIG